MPAQNLHGLMADRTDPLGQAVAWWPLNEGAGEGANNIGTATCRGLLKNGARYGGLNGMHGVLFDGTDDFVEINSLRGIAQLCGQGQHTICAWVSTRAATTRQLFLGDWHSGGDGGTGFEIRTDSQFQYWMKSTPYVNNTAIGGTVVTTRPQFVVGVYDLSFVHLYVDAVRVASTAVAGLIVNDEATLDLTLGRTGGYSGLYFNGMLSNVRLYNRALTGAEIHRLYANPMAGAKIPNIARLYKAATAPASPSPVVSLQNMSGYPRLVRGVGNLSGSARTISQKGNLSGWPKLT